MKHTFTISKTFHNLWTKTWKPNNASLVLIQLRVPLRDSWHIPYILVWTTVRGILGTCFTILCSWQFFAPDFDEILKVSCNKSQLSCSTWVGMVFHLFGVIHISNINVYSDSNTEVWNNSYNGIILKKARSYQFLLHKIHIIQNILQGDIDATWCHRICLKIAPVDFFFCLEILRCDILRINSKALWLVKYLKYGKSNNCHIKIEFVQKIDFVHFW